MRVWLRRFGWGLWTLSVLLVAAMHVVGQRSIWTAVLVYSPVHLWVLCLALTTIAGWFADRRLLLASVVALAIMAGPLWGWRRHSPVLPETAMHAPDMLRVLTANRGQNYGHRLADMIQQEQPDLIALQDGFDKVGFAHGISDYAYLPFTARQGEFALHSRYEILKSALIQPLPSITAINLKGHSRVPAMRCEVNLPQGKTAVYVVHLPSPRRELRAFLHDPFDAKARADMALFWDMHRAMMEQLLGEVESDPLPVIALGDFNQPPIGPNQRRLTAKLQDAHEKAGLGYGYTFPGDFWNPLSLGQFWMRLDRVLTSPDWEPLHSQAEPQSQAQHAAVLAVLRRCR